jgi:hypothetical protein
VPRQYSQTFTTNMSQNRRRCPYFAWAFGMVSLCEEEYVYLETSRRGESEKGVRQHETSSLWWPRMFHNLQRAAGAPSFHRLACALINTRPGEESATAFSPFGDRSSRY